jgi:MFS transporter, ACS family, tartrate transporter
VILYFTYWFPKSYRARVISMLFIAVPGSNAVAAIISGAVLEMDGLLGLTGWQWMFIVEAVPAVLLAFAVLALLTDRPAVATWLEPAEREWLESALRDERRQIESAGHLGLFQALTDARVLILSLIYLTIVTATYGITFFLPQIVKGIGLSNMMTGLVTAIPYTIGTIGMLLWGASSDRYDERRWHFCLACMLATIGLIGAGVFGSSFLALAFMSVATIGLYGSKPAFWPMPSLFLNRSRWHRDGQFNRQSGRLFWAIHCRLDQVQHRKFRSRTLLPRCLCSCVWNHRLLRRADFGGGDARSDLATPAE